MGLITNDIANQGGFPFFGQQHHSHHHTPHHFDILADIRKDVGDCQSTIKDSIHQLLTNQNIEFRHIHQRICDSEKENLKATFESRIETLKGFGVLTKEITDRHFETDKKFERLFEAGLKTKIEDLRSDLAKCECTGSTQSALDRILMAIAGIPVVTGPMAAAAKV